MFTGLIEEVGVVRRVELTSDGCALSIEADMVIEDLKVNSSIAVDGVCLTVVGLDGNSFDVHVVPESLERSTLKRTAGGTKVNLERPLTLSGRLGGHLVQGHVDGVGKITAFDPVGDGAQIQVKIPETLQRYVVAKGSIAIDGISLTVARLKGQNITIALIPQTLTDTTIGLKPPGDEVNIEVDIIAKYVERLTAGGESRTALSLDDLSRMGYS